MLQFSTEQMALSEYNHGIKASQTVMYVFSVNHAEIAEPQLIEIK